MPYRIAGIDVHKKMLAVVVADVEVDGEYQFERRKVGTSPTELRALADWLVEREVEEVVMESTAQYWRPVWEALERYWRPQRRAGRAPRPCRAPASRAGPVESWRRRAEEGLSRCRTLREAPGRPGTDFEFCARRRAAALADGHAPQVPAHPQSRANFRTVWNLCWRKRISSCPASSRICWASARDGCCRRWRTAKPIRPPSRRWRISDYAPRRNNCATRSASARRCIPSTGGF